MRMRNVDFLACLFGLCRIRKLTKAKTEKRENFQRFWSFLFIFPGKTLNYLRAVKRYRIELKKK